MTEWLGPAVIGAVITALGAIIVAAINKRRTAPEQRLDALDVLQKVMQEVQEERTHHLGEARLAREELVQERAAHAATKAAAEVERDASASRESRKDAYIELLRDHITKGHPPPPPPYPKGI